MITSCEFHFGFWDVTAREDAVFTASENQPWAVIEDISMEEPVTAHPDAATLEPDFGWPLNGTKPVFPDNPQNFHWGWWSTQLSREDGTFTNPPELITTFSHSHSSAGITLMFEGALPQVINIKWYALNGTLLADKDFSPDSMTCFCDYQVEDYGKVAIAVKSMSAAHRFLRCVYILFGVLEIIDDSRILKAELTEELDPIALTLPIQTMLLTFFTTGGRFSLLDPSGAYRLFQWKQQMSAFSTIDGNRQPMGVYYLQEASGFVDSVAELALVDSIGILDTVTHLGGIYAAVPLRTFLEELLTPEGIDFELDPVFESVTLTGHLPIGSKRTALQQAAFAIGAMVDTTRGELMRIYPAPITVSRSIGPDRKIVGHNVTFEELITRVDVTAHSYRLDDEVKELVKSELSTGQHTLHFSVPSNVAQVTGGTLIINHPNYAVVDVQTAGEVILTGVEYVDDTSVYTVQTGSLPAGAKSSVKSVDKATLVDSTKAAAAARRVYDYYQRRYTADGRILPGNEKVGQMIELQSLGGKTLTGVTERLVIDLAGGHIAKLTMRGA